MDATTARRFFQEYVTTIYEKGRVEELGRFYTRDVVPHPDIPGMEPGLNGMKVVIRSWLDAFSSMRYTIDSLVFQRDIIAPRISVNAVHTGAFMGIPATGRNVTVVSHPHYRLEHGKIAEFWDMPDMLSLLQQLGVFSAPSLAAWYPTTRLGITKNKPELVAPMVAGISLVREYERV
ncbi:ester cyclase [Archangium gephyra]|nr:ester cyclase [Archangium gephyra]